MMTDYQERDSTLASMGYASYGAYLESGLWNGIRRYVLSRDGRLCCKCGGPAGQVHHSSYARAVLAGDDLSRLHSVCGICHDQAEKTSEGKKRSLAQANSILLSVNMRRPAHQQSRKVRNPVQSRCSCGNTKKADKNFCKSCLSISTSEFRKLPHYGDRAKKIISRKQKKNKARNAAKVSRAVELSAKEKDRLLMLAEATAAKQARQKQEAENAIANREKRKEEKIALLAHNRSPKLIYPMAEVVARALKSIK